MLKYLFVLLMTATVIFAEEKRNLKEPLETKSIPCQNIRYFMTYPQTSFFTFSDYKSFFTPIPMVGIGFRTHKNAHGFDGSLNCIKIDTFRNYYIPIIKLSYLNYPFYKKEKFFYWGLTTALYCGILPLPFGSIGYEFNTKKPIKFFTQIDFTYHVVGLNLGFGF